MNEEIPVDIQSTTVQVTDLKSEVKRTGQFS